MSQYLVGNLTPELWLVHPEVGWLDPTDAQGDTVRDLRISDNRLSVFEVDDDASTAHIERIVVAIGAAGKEEPTDVGYRLFDPAQLRPLDIEAVKSKGLLGDPALNGLHRDLVRISATKLGQLAAVIAHGRGGIVSSKDFERILRREVDAGRLAPNSKLREYLNRK